MKKNKYANIIKLTLLLLMFTSGLCGGYIYAKEKAMTEAQYWARTILNTHCSDEVLNGISTGKYEKELEHHKFKPNKTIFKQNKTSAPKLIMPKN